MSNTATQNTSEVLPVFIGAHNHYIDLNKSKALVIMSRPHDGKTVTASILAAALTQMGNVNFVHKDSDEETVRNTINDFNGVPVKFWMGSIDDYIDWAALERQASDDTKEFLILDNVGVNAAYDIIDELPKHVYPIITMEVGAARSQRVFGPDNFENKFHLIVPPELMDRVDMIHTDFLRSEMRYQDLNLDKQSHLEITTLFSLYQPIGMSSRFPPQSLRFDWRREQALLIEEIQKPCRFQET